MGFAWPDKGAVFSGSAPKALRSPSVELLSARLNGTRKHHILDLGAPCGANVDFFSQFSCKLYIEDIYENLTIPESEEGPTDDELRDCVRAALSSIADNHYELILGWDLFNYFAPPVIRMLMSELRSHCHSGSLLFMVVPTSATISELPARLSIQSDQRLTYSALSDGERPNPRHSPVALERMMPQFSLLHSFLLGDGLQEFLFSRD